jgi:hypothetical protein
VQATFLAIGPACLNRPPLGWAIDVEKQPVFAIYVLRGAESVLVSNGGIEHVAVVSRDGANVRPELNSLAARCAGTLGNTLLRGE